MGNQLCPAATKDFIQGFRELQKGEKQYHYHPALKCCVSQQTLEEPQFLYFNENKNQKDNQIGVSTYQNSNIQTECLMKQSTSLEVQLSMRKNLLEHESQLVQSKKMVELLLSNGWRYKGEAIGSIPEGKGEEFGPRGQRYFGHFYRGKKEGYGIYKFANGSVYKGEFKENLMWGHGTFQFLNGDLFQGEFVKNKRQGKGKYMVHQPNIDDLLYFEGEYKNDMKNGVGVMKYFDYEMKGQWKDGNYDYSFQSGRS